MRDDDFEYFHQLPLLTRSVSYGADSILNLISITRFPCTHCLSHLEQKRISGRWATPSNSSSDEASESRTDAPTSGQAACSIKEDNEGQLDPTSLASCRQSNLQTEHPPSVGIQETSSQGSPGFFPCRQCSYKQREHRIYLVGQLLNAVEAGKIDLWDSELAKKLRPPANKTLPKIGDTLFSNDVIQWMSSGSLTNSDLVKFCREEKIRVVFKYDQPVNQAQNHDETGVSVPTPTCIQDTQPTAIDNQALSTDSQPYNQSRTSLIGPTATYLELAKAFAVVSSEDANLKWFRERCSNPRRYKAFQLALATPGKRGGDAARFYVLSIVAHLHEKEGINLRKLRLGIEKRFPSALDLFDTYFWQQNSFDT